MIIMKKLNIILALCSVLVLLPACKDFLNQPAYDDFLDEEYWNTEDQARTFMYGFYPSVFAGYGSGFSHGPFLMGETSNDDFASAKEQTDFSTQIPESNGSWSFSNIRRANYALANVPRINADDEAIAHWQGVARFFRACYYSSLVFTFGDVPWYDRVPMVSESKEDLDYLYKDRDSRLFVDSMIMLDFQYALDHVRVSDGAQQVNKYVVAGMASRYMLREGTYLKYHKISEAGATKCLRMAKDMALFVMNSGKYSIAPSYSSLFVSEDLSSNPEIIMSRHYADGVLSHSTLTYSFTEAQNGLSKSLAMAFGTDDGVPVYVRDEFWIPRTDTMFFEHRDPRLTFCIRPHYYLKGTNCTPYGYALSGFSWRKFMDDEHVATVQPTWSGSKNVTDAPCLRYAEVLLNYAEATYELSTLDETCTFTTEDLNKSINLIRKRADVNLPALSVNGDKPSVEKYGAYDDPMRQQLEVVAITPDASSITNEMVSPILWEIRRERRVELCMEGFRNADLKRWRRLDYMWNECNPDIRYGVYIVLDRYSKEEIEQGEIVLDDSLATEGYLLRNTLRQRNRPLEKNYISPVPTGQITLYESKGYKLSQTKEWQ